MKGIDSAAPLTAQAAQILAESGIRFSGRYLVPTYGGTNWKALTADEATHILDAGLALLLVWETDAARAKGGAAAGATDGARARQLAQDMGVPAGTTIFFAVDYCPDAGEYGIIAEYLKAADMACGEYVAGVYGSYFVVEAMAERHACTKFWQCVAWSSGKVSEKLHVYQYQWQGGAEAMAVGQKIGIKVDMNSCEDLEAAGLWMRQEEPQEDEGKEEVKRYNTVAEIEAEAPWAVPTIQKLISTGCIQGKGSATDADGNPADMDLSMDMIRVFVIHDRAGLYPD